MRVQADANSPQPGGSGFYSHVVTCTVAAFYLTVLVVDRAAGVLYALLILLGLFALLHPNAEGRPSAFRLWRQHWLLLLACCGPLLAVLANELSRGQLSFRNIDSPLRLALFALVLLAVRRMSLPQLRGLQWCFVLAALVGAVKMYMLTEGGQVRYGTDFIPIITFAELSLLLGCFGLLTLAWNRQTDRLALLVKCLAALAALYCSYLSQSRGTWATIPVFMLIGAVAAGRRLRYRRRMAAAALILLVLGAGMSPVGRGRVAEAKQDVQQFITGKNADTSLGFRLQLWHGSLVLLKEHPVFGVGIEQYPQALKGLARRGVITELAAGFQHSHNEVLFAAARLGLLGVLAVLGMYFLPVLCFARWLRHTDAEIRAVAAMAVALCLGLFVLGLSDVVFLWWEVYPFYALSIALFATHLSKRRGELEMETRTGL